MIKFCSILIICCSIVQSWQIQPQGDGISPEGHNKLRKDASPEDSNNSPETVTVERIIKSSVFSYPTEDKDKSASVFSHTGPGNVNTTIRLKFIKPDQTGKLDYDITQDNIRSNEHSTGSQAQKMSSHRIILFNQTKPHEVESKRSSKILLEQLNQLKWPLNDENQNNLKDDTVEKAVQVTYIDLSKKKIEKEEIGNQNEKGERSKQKLDERQALLETITKYIKEHDQPKTTETPVNRRYKITEPQMQLLNLLYKLVASKEITYDFINRLIYLFHTHGYQNQLLRVLFDFIIRQLQSQGNSEHQQQTLNNLIEIWNVLIRLQDQTPGDINKNKKPKPDKPSSEHEKVLRLLLLLEALKDSNKHGNAALRSSYLSELRSLYGTFDNKNELMKIIHNHLKKQQLDKNKPTSTEKIPWEAPGHNTKPDDINVFIQSILKQNGLDNKNKGLGDHEKEEPSLDKIKVKKSKESPRDERWRILLKLASENKKTSSMAPNDLLIIHKIIEEIEDDDHVPEEPTVNTNKSMKIKKNMTQPPRLDKKERTERMYHMLLELLQSSEVRNKEELKVQIIEMLRKIESQAEDSGDESSQDDQGDLVKILDLINNQKNKEDDKKGCVVGTSWTTDCQNCICMTGGVAICKKIPECIIGPKPEKPMQCKPNTKFRLDKCNLCKCNSVGVPICTLMECDEPVPRDSGSKKLFPEQDAMKAILCHPKRKMPVCAPRTSWGGSCYNCICDDDGQRHCNVIKNCKILSSGKVKEALVSQTPL